jgi:EpsI family protein
MRLFDRNLITLLSMLGLAAGLVYVPLPASSPEVIIPTSSASHTTITVEGWPETHGVPGEILPIDPRAKENTRWTYRHGDRVVWVAVGIYNPANSPESRPSVNFIVPERGARELSQRMVNIRIENDQESSLHVKQVTVARPSDHLAVVYWYQLGPKIIPDEYRLRLGLLVNTLLRRKEDLVLVRVATVHPAFAEPFSSSATLEEFLQAFFPKIARTHT